MSRPDSYYYAQSFGVVLYLVGKGYEPLRAELSRDGTGKTLYIFPAAARDELEGFHELKDRLNQMGLEARQQAFPISNRAGVTGHDHPADH